MSNTLPTLTDDELHQTGLVVVPGPLDRSTIDLVAGYAAGLYDRAQALRIPPPGVIADPSATEVRLIPWADPDAIADARAALNP